MKQPKRGGNIKTSDGGAGADEYAQQERGKEETCRRKTRERGGDSNPCYAGEKGKKTDGE